MHKQHDTSKIEGILETVEEAGEDPDRVSIEEMLAEIGTDAFPAVILVPALIMISPASGIPGLSTVGALIIALAAIQMVLGRKTLWLPQFLQRRTIKRRSLDRTVRWLNRPAHFVDKMLGRRLVFLTRRPFRQVLGAICLVIACAVPFLELVPFSASIAATAIAFFAVGLVAGDGLLVLIGFLAAGGATTVVYWLVAQ
jgi:hypothetical protein